MQYHYTSADLKKGITPDQLGLEYINCKRWELAKGDEYNLSSEENETCLFVIQGKPVVEYNGSKEVLERMDCLYLPMQENYLLTSLDDAVIIEFSAPVDKKTECALLRGDRVFVNPECTKTVGDKLSKTERKVVTYLGDSFNARRLMVGVGFGDTGGWTVWPPHEHTRQREEAYVYFNMNEAFGIQCVYEDIRNPLYVGIVLDGDIVSVPKGYHPNVGCPAGAINYIFCMAAKVPGERHFMDLSFQKEYGNSF